MTNIQLSSTTLGKIYYGLELYAFFIGLCSLCTTGTTMHLAISYSVATITAAFVSRSSVVWDPDPSVRMRSPV